MKSIYNMFLSVILFTSCSAEIADVVEQNNESYADKITITMEPFKNGGNTRVSISDANFITSYITSWDVADEIGVFPTAPQNNMIVDKIKKLDKDNHYGYIENGWNIDLLNKYTAFYPVSALLPVNTPFNAVPVSVRGFDGTLDDIAKNFDYMWAKGSIIENVASLKGKAMLNFHFKQAIAILRLNTWIPIGSYSRFEVVDEDGNLAFISDGTLDTQTGIVTPVSNTNGFSIGFNKTVSGSWGRSMVYIPVFPTNINIKKLTYRLYNDKGQVITHTVYFRPKVFAAGYVYRYVLCTWRVDLGLSATWSKRPRGGFNVGGAAGQGGGAAGQGAGQGGGAAGQGAAQGDDAGQGGTAGQETSQDEDDHDIYYKWDEGKVDENQDSIDYPTKEQWEELLSSCQLKLESDGDKYYFEVVGPNGKTIWLYIVGYKDENGDIKGEEWAYYWTNELDYSSIPSGGTAPENAWAIKINKDNPDNPEFVSMSRNNSLCVMPMEKVEDVDDNDDDN